MLHDNPSLFRLVFKTDLLIVIRCYHKDFNMRSYRRL